MGTREEADKASRWSRARHEWQNRKRATGRLGEMFRSRAQPNEHRRQPQRWLKSHPRCVLRGGPRDIVDREERCDRDGGGRHPGEGHELSMEMGPVDVAALRRSPRRRCDPRRLAACGQRVRTAAAGMDVEVEAVLDHLGVRHHMEPDAGPSPRGSMMLSAPIPSSLSGSPMSPRTAACHFGGGR